jgi:hypothetical protein
MRRKTVVREHYIPIAIVDRMAKSRPTYLHPRDQPVSDELS